MTVMIKDWFYNKIKNEIQYKHLIQSECEVIKETEKAYLLSVEYVTTDGEYDGYVEKWCPKSCTLTVEEFKKERENEKNRFEDGCQRYEALVKFAKDHLVKGVRSGMRKETILNKIAQAGLEYAY